MPAIRIKRGTRAQLNSAASASGLAAGELYLVTDEGRIAVGTAAGGYAAAVMEAQAINAQTGTSYTLVLADVGKLVTRTNAAASTVTIPPNSSVAIPVGCSVDLAQMGAGQVTFAPGSGVTLRATPGLKLRAQYSGATVMKIATDEWLIVGDLAE